MKRMEIIDPVFSSAPLPILQRIGRYHFEKATGIRWKPLRKGEKSMSKCLIAKPIGCGHKKTPGGKTGSFMLNSRKQNLKTIENT
jgi:hypothetical protein